MNKLILVGIGASAMMALSACTDLQTIDGATPVTTGLTTATGPVTTVTSTAVPTALVPTTNLGTVTQTQVATNTTTFNGQAVQPMGTNFVSQPVTIRQPGVAPVNTTVIAQNGQQPIPGQIYVTADGQIIIYDPQNLPIVGPEFEAAE